MGPSQDESNGGNLQPPVEGVDVVSPRKKLNLLPSCSSSPNDPFVIPTAEDDYEPNISTSNAASPNLSSLSSTNLLITESPTMQVMERMDTSHRIPSSVFELDHSSDPVQWSTASSDSLFSIHIGNASISGEYGPWSSDERGTTGEASSIDRPVHTRQVSDRPSVKLRAVEASLEALEEDPRESEDHNHEKSFAEGRGSNASVKSFAFPILAGEDSAGKLACSARFPEPEPAPSSTQETEPSPQSDPEAAQKKWFSCFPCCS